MGLVSSDGTPTPRYIEFRNPDKSGLAIAESMREVYAPLFEMNEYVYELDNSKLKSLIVEATGAEVNSTHVKKTLSTFIALKKLADFEATNTSSTSEQIETNDAENFNQIPSQANAPHARSVSEGINLSYTINLNLPATKDIEVFNAIFKSLKQHLLQD